MEASINDKLPPPPRVPDAHGEAVNERLFSDLYIRTSWVNADLALEQIKKVRVSSSYVAECFSCTHCYASTPPSNIKRVGETCEERSARDRV